MRYVETGKFMVMSGQEGFGPRCFELNAVDLPSREAAEAEAARRNRVEREAGHDNVTWFPMPMHEFRP